MTDASRSADARNRAMAMASEDPAEALKAARRIPLPWYRAQACFGIFALARGHTGEARALGIRAASEGEDLYQQVAVRAWELRALATRGEDDEAWTLLKELLARVAEVTPRGSLAGALDLLARAACHLAPEAVATVLLTFDRLQEPNDHWRMQRLAKEAKALRAGDADAIVPL